MSSLEFVMSNSNCGEKTQRFAKLELDNRDVLKFDTPISARQKRKVSAIEFGPEMPADKRAGEVMLTRR